MTVSVVVPSYQRPESLMRCLQAIDRQTKPPDEVVVVCRSSDVTSIDVVSHWVSAHHPYQARFGLVDVPGQIAALRRGLEMICGDIVVLTDDDTVPRPDWIERLVVYYRDPTVGGVGGRDIINGLGDTPVASRVGVITWYGKMIGNHHLGCKQVSEVDVLKGANASFRRHLVQLPTFFKGEGAEVHNEVYICLGVRKLGYKIIYDPQICVDHFPGPRFDVDQRDGAAPQAIRNAAFNVTVTSWIFTPWRKRIAMLLFNVLIGQKGAPGIARVIAAVCTLDSEVILSYLPAYLGQLDGLVYFFLMRRSLTDFSSLNRANVLTK